ncbi:Bacterial alpha-L-rhamnosidase [compost metagenome]
MNSFNHYSFGAVGAWLCNYSLGIDRDPPAQKKSEMGFKHFHLHPEPDPTEKMTYARGYYDCLYGKIESSWEKRGGAMLYRFVVPANTSATLSLRAASSAAITEKGRLLQSSKGVKYIGMLKEKHVFELQSGIYHITVN